MKYPCTTHNRKDKPSNSMVKDLTKRTKDGGKFNHTKEKNNKFKLVCICYHNTVINQNFNGTYCFISKQN